MPRVRPTRVDGGSGLSNGSLSLTVVTRSRSEPHLIARRASNLWPIAKKRPTRTSCVSLSADGHDAEVMRILGLSSRVVIIGLGVRSWVVVSDPEGKEFCDLRSDGSAE